MHRKNLKLCIILLIAVILLTGCWDRREIENQITAIALAVDSVDDRLRITIQVPIPINIAGSGGGGGGSSGQDAVQLFTATGTNVNDAFKNLQKQLNQELSLGHLSLIVISEELARNGIDEITDALGRNPEVRRLIWPLITKGEAVDALRANPKLEQIPAIYFVRMLENETEQERMLDVTLGNMLNDLTNETKQPLINYVQAKENGVNWLGTALFNGYRMVAHLDEEDSWVMMHLRDGKRGSKFSAECPNGRSGEITIEPKTVKRKLAFDETNMAFTIDVKLGAVISEKSCPTYALDSEKAYREIEHLFETALEKRARDVVDDLQRHKTDALLLGTYVRAFHPKLWQRLDWPDAFSKAKIDVNYTVYIKSRGALYR